MKKLFLSLIFFSVICLNGGATELKGEISYTVDSARTYLQEGEPSGVNIPSQRYSFSAENTQRVVYSHNNSGDVIGITVQYINENSKAYIYNGKGKLIYVDIYDKPVYIYPHRGYRYDTQGNLNLTSLSVSKNELFRFSPDGKLIAHSVNGIIYDENGSVIGRGK